jgi:hypothetical protein
MSLFWNHYCHFYFRLFLYTLERNELTNVTIIETVKFDIKIIANERLNPRIFYNN